MLLAGPHLHLSERRFIMDDPQESAVIVRDYIPMSKTCMLVISYARLVTRSINKILLVTHRTCLTTRSTRSTLLFTRSTCLIQP